ncbi:MAG: bifunctional DNA-formamidopyrimidine glycosylase/DNA-(apurinic or apyrimidinic site) lyase [Patescibacteria group bacterium]|jgi:formamidopyrimidine-DNA glycosylase|nr:bifunctional DNA-formamidopyrimidine glycosylase/DNA-(apurinic or apyrimidinic site) lyase [Patescibacteria group bacterium]
MPELPEVETIRNDLSEKIVNKKIVKLEVKKVKLVKNTQEVFMSVLLNSKFSYIDRIGKLLIFTIKKGDLEKYLLVHLKMTGQFIYVGKNEVVAGGHSNSREESKKYRLGGLEKDLPNKFSHVIFHFHDGSTLYFNDMRQFGYLKIVDALELKMIKGKYGIEPLQKNFTWKNFQKVCEGKRTNIKAFLLNQHMISGLGNIYVDEILFASGILPTRNVSALNEDELRELFENTKNIIKKAIKQRGTTFSDYVDSKGERGGFANFLKVYGKEKTVCPKCLRTKILKIKVAGRGTRFCPRCQN